VCVLQKITRGSLLFETSEKSNKTNKYIASYLPETTESEAVNSHLKKQSAAKEKVLKGHNGKLKQMQSVIDGLSKEVECLNRTVRLVSTCKIQVVTTLQWTKMFMVINRVKCWPNTEGFVEHFGLQHLGFLWKIFISRLCPAPSMHISNPLSTEL